MQKGFRCEDLCHVTSGWQSSSATKAFKRATENRRRLQPCEAVAAAVDASDEEPIKEPRCLGPGLRGVLGRPTTARGGKKAKKAALAAAKLAAERRPLHV